MGSVVLGTSCKKYFDVNHNPNSAASVNVTPQLLLPGALNTTAGILNSYNTMGAQIGGSMANAGGYGGFGTAFTYNYGSGEQNGTFGSAYDNLEDYQTILNMTDKDPLMANFNAAARIMKALNFELLVDTYNDVPYTQALKGSEVLSPVYDKGTDIYKDLADQLDKAIAAINSAPADAKALGASDILFKADMSAWKKFANTIKLRLFVRGNGKVTFASTTFSADGFLTSDALINPGYVRDNGKQNPKFATWAFNYAGTTGNKSWMPSTWILSFYNGVKLSDPGRGGSIYYKFPNTSTNQLGYDGPGTDPAPDGNFWYPAVKRDGASAGDTTGVLKGSNAGMPVITAAESFFLQAEAVVRGILKTGDAKALFESGVTSSFQYLYSKPDGSFSGNPTADADKYMHVLNTGIRTADFAAASGTEEQIEAIITQKYIALNMVNNNESWNDYRRTAYPKLVNSPSAKATETFASKQSESTRPDRLPSRVLYPSSEGSYNSANMPQSISPFTSTIFWAL